ncbi:MAG: hypothetical protein ACI95C_001752 [Pseudohongiellaceae bacterium]
MSHRHCARPGRNRHRTQRGRLARHQIAIGVPYDGGGRARRRVGSGSTGDDFHILCDGNKAPGDADANGEDPTFWNFKRAYDTAMEYQRPNVYWLEEPLPRYDYEQLAELNRLVAMPMAGGESNWGIHEFRGLLEQGCLDALMPEMQI